ncbi:MAG: hypothetical protein WA440_07065 [Ignavibacteriaceae bacterium]
MNEIVIYTTPDNQTELEVKFEGESFWLSLNQMAQLFERDKSVISKHLRNIYREGKMENKSTIAKIINYSA